MAFTVVTGLTPTFANIDGNMATTLVNNILTGSNKITSATDWRYSQTQYMLSSNYSFYCKINSINFGASMSGALEIAFAAPDTKNPIISIIGTTDSYKIRLLEDGYVAREVVTIPRSEGIEICYSVSNRNTIYLNGQTFTFNSIKTEASITFNRFMFTFWNAPNTQENQVIDFAYFGVSYTSEDFSILANRVAAKNALLKVVPLYRPEIKWKRMNSSNPIILYAGGIVYSDSNNYTATSINEANVNFKFKGTGLRILIYTYNTSTYKRCNQYISIDEGTPQLITVDNTMASPNTLIYEINNLTDEIHTIKLTPSYNSATGQNIFSFGAFDVYGGKEVHYFLNEKDNIQNMSIGDVIPCEYSATNGVFGTLFNLGSNQKDLLPPTPSTSPNGSFYFIKVAPGLLIADKVLQHTISYQTLKDAGLIDGKVITLNGQNFLLRLIDGGNIFSNGFSPSTVDLDLGAYPLNNEWDKYIVSSNLNNKITAGDDKIWNYMSVSTLTKNTDLNNSSNYITRGRSPGVQKLKGLSYGTKTTGYNTVGFRPVLEYIDTTIATQRRPKTFWY